MEPDTAKPSAQSAEGQLDPAPAVPPTKPVHSLVLDANAIIRNEPSVSTLLAQAEELYTIPAVVSESISSNLFIYLEVYSRRWLIPLA